MAMAGPSQAEDLFTCSVCLEEFDDPRSLNCLHTFCLGCLNAIARRVPERDHVPCPVCQHETPLPESGVNGLKKDFKIEQMKELLDTNTNENKTGQVEGRMCDACKGRKKGMAAFHCTACLVFFCETCIDKHSDNVMFRDHTVNVVPTNAKYCMVHVGHAVGYVCQCEPDILLCALCIMDHDEDHEVQTITQARHAMLLHTLGLVEDTKKYLQGHLEDVQKMTNNYEAMLIKVHKLIREQAKRMMNEVKRQEEELIRDAHRAVRDALNKYQEEGTVANLQYTERVEAYINRVMQNPDDSKYLKEAKVQKDFVKFRKGIRPKAMPDTGIMFEFPAELPPIHLGHLRGVRNMKKVTSRKNDGLQCKNRH